MFLAMMLITAAVVCGAVSAADGTWTTETVDSTGFSPSLAFDPSGNPHISYEGGVIGDHDLRYASKVGDTWTIETVDSAGDVGKSSSLAFDSGGNPHISYQDFTNDDLKYASKVGGIWTTETVDSAGDTGYDTSLAFDLSGIPHISYYDRSLGDLRYASKVGGIWTTETVDSAGDTGWFTSLSFDPSGNPGISYYKGDQITGELKYASKVGANPWTPETVDNTVGDVGWYTSLAFDSSGIPHISYYDHSNGDLKYANKIGPNLWNFETVDSAGDVGWYSSLAFDSSGIPHISYQSGGWSGDHDLRYASKIAFNVWTTETVDSAGKTGYMTSLAFDPSGNPHISYWGLTNNVLKYASFGSDNVVPGNSANNAEVNAVTGTSSNIIGMQNTGAPFAGMVLAFLLIFSGLLIPRIK